MGIIISGIVSFLKMVNILLHPKIFEQPKFAFISEPPNKRQLFIYNLILFFVAIEAFYFFWFLR